MTNKQIIDALNVDRATNATFTISVPASVIATARAFTTREDLRCYLLGAAMDAVTAVCDQLLAATDADNKGNQ